MTIDTAEIRRDSKSRHTGKPRSVSVGLRAVRFAFGTFGRLFPGMAGMIAYTMVFRPTRKRHREGFAALLDEATIDRSLICNGKIVTSYVWGATGPAVLLVHGWESNAGRFFRLISRLSAAGYRVIAFDAPAHGRSQGKETDFIEFVQVLGWLGQKYGPFEAAFGHSFGGMSLTYAVRHGLPVKLVILISAPSRFDGLKEKLRALLAAPPGVVENVSVRVERRFAAHSSNVWVDFSPRENASAIEAPALIFHDKDDAEVPVIEASELHRAWRSSRLVLTSGLGHHRIADSDEVIEAAVQFIRDPLLVAPESA